MTSFNLSEIEEQLNAVNKNKQPYGVSFSGKALKLNQENDALDVIEAIMQCEELEYLDLEGNTLGPEAAEAISKVISKKAGPLKRALWKDMFTGRMKNEIPLALEHLGHGLCSANTRLIELDLSDNAFGPIGVTGLASLLMSSSCYTLQELRLNNNGLGIYGGKMLSQALLKCHTKSLKDTNKPLALKVFIAGRNRLENDGAKALAHVFETLKSLEEVVMPQNGIYHIGIKSLATALSLNPELRILNLNDNTVGVKGATALANVLPTFQKLEKLNLGDCLLMTKGALVISYALRGKTNHPSLIELNLSFNEIRKHAITSLAEAVENKSALSMLVLDGNFFGSDGCEELRALLIKSKQIDSLGSLDEDEPPSDEDDSTDEEDQEDTQEEDEYENDNDSEETEDSEPFDVVEQKNNDYISVNDFLKNPTDNNFLLLQGDKVQNLKDFIKKNTNDNPPIKYIEELTTIIMKISAHCGSSYVDVRTEAEKVTDLLYAELFSYAASNSLTSAVNDTLLINLGLIKTEDKYVNKIDWNLEYCFKALEKVTQQDYFPRETKSILILFIKKPSRPFRIKDKDSVKEAKNCLKAVLEQCKTV